MYLKGKKNGASKPIKDKVGSLHAILKEMNGFLWIRDWIMPVLKNKNVIKQRDGLHGIWIVGQSCQTKRYTEVI